MSKNPVQNQNIAHSGVTNLKLTLPVKQFSLDAANSTVLATHPQRVGLSSVLQSVTWSA